MPPVSGSSRGGLTAPADGTADPIGALGIFIVFRTHNLFATHHGLAFFAADGFEFHKCLRYRLELVFVGAQDVPGLAFASRYDATDFFVDQFGCFFTHVLALRDGVDPGKTSC